MSRFHDLSRRLAAVSSDENDQDDENTPDDPTNPKCKKKDHDMSDEQNAAALGTAKKEGHDAGFKAANDRMNTVFASEHYAGREAMAAKLLSKPGMSAEDIIDVLADTPKADKKGLSEEEQRAAAEAAGREVMKDALASGAKNSNIDANDGNKPDSAAAVNDLWGQAVKSVAG